ncbi:MAG TPA: class I SAM-dependent methyltransferase [Planctomycetota bacterium]|nr:class I SAM-dependent methyltransferase [Planctomycetota bacterium]
MDAHVYEQFRNLQENHFWFIGRRRIFFDLLERELGRGGGRTVLEIGCGAGGMLKPLARFGAVYGIDIATEYVQVCAEHGLARMVAGSGDALPFADRTFDLVALFDVIEHIPDERATLAEVRRVLKPGGTVFVSVPAYQFLFSQNDRVVHHQRRYTAAQLRRRLREAGLQPKKVSYFNTFLFPLIAAAVVTLKLKERWFGLPPGETNLDHEFRGPLNAALAFVMGSERWLLRHMNFPFGHSLIAMAG